MDRTDWAYLTFRLPVELHKKLQQEAERLGVSLKSLMIFAIWQHFDNDNADPK